MTRSVLLSLLLCVSGVTHAPARAAESAPTEEMRFPLRGKTLSLSIYRPAGVPKGTIIMGSGDVGWVGLSVSMAEYLSERGFVVIGLNSRQYLSTFTNGKEHLNVLDPAADFEAMRALLEREHLLHRPVVLSGVSEGAAIAVLAASHEGNHHWIDGVVTMGTPMVAELAWRWTDFTSWITKKDLNEPSFSPLDFIGRIAPVPLVMIQSRRDEYVSESDYTRLERIAGHPKRMVLIDANNHRFTNKQTELRAEMLSALAWIAASRNPGRP